MVGSGAARRLDAAVAEVSHAQRHHTEEIAS
jgi:hypothetical protein